MNRIANDHLTIYVNPRGAELCSIKGDDGFEYLWQAAPEFWSRHAPVLYPIVGKLRDGRYELNGKTFELPPHGFARDMDFSLIEKSETSLVYQLLPPFAPSAFAGFFAAMAALTPRLALGGVSLLHIIRLSKHSAPKHPMDGAVAFDSIARFRNCALLAVAASPILRRLAHPSGRNGFVILRTICLFPVALHPALLRRSYFQLPA